MGGYNSIDEDSPGAKEFLLWVVDRMDDDEILIYLAMTHGFDVDEYGRNASTYLLPEEQEGLK